MNLKRPDISSPVLSEIDADVYMTFGINYMSSQVIAQAKRLGKRFYSLPVTLI